MRLGVDVGGTFTDLLLHDEKTQRTYQAKTPSTPQDQSIGVAAGVKLICEKAGVSPSDISLILHGTTVATNAVLEGKGARVGLLVTEGFEYTLHLAKAWTPGPLFGWIVMDKPDPLASLADTRGIPERVNARGEVIHPLDVAKATALIDDLCSSGIEALTISLMHAYANPSHEQQLREIVAERFPDIPVSLSSDILPEFREYDRAITTVMNDYVRPIMKRYLVADRRSAQGRGRQGEVAHRSVRRRADERERGLRTAGSHRSFRAGRRRDVHRHDCAANRLQEVAGFRHGRNVDRRFGHFGWRADDLAFDRSRLFPSQSALRLTCAASGPAAARSRKSPI